MRTWEKPSLEKGEREAIEEAARMLRRLHPVGSVVLFGSKARGDGDQHSDIDLLIVTSRTLHWKEEKDIVEQLFDIGMKHDAIFSPLFVSGDEWDGGLFSEFPICREILREGVLVP